MRWVRMKEVGCHSWAQLKIYLVDLPELTRQKAVRVYIENTFGERSQIQSAFSAPPPNGGAPRSSIQCARLSQSFY
jgi:hypothetical protein